MMLKKFIIGGGLSLCLLLGVILYHCKEIKQEGEEESISKDNLCVSENQNGYPMSNFGVSISNEEIMTDGAEVFEFEIKNESNRKWYWYELFKVNGMEINLDGIWYQMPVNDKNDHTLSLLEHPLPPGRSMTVFCHPDFYQNMIPGHYRYTVLMYDYENHKFKISSEFLVVEEE